MPGFSHDTKLEDMQRVIIDHLTKLEHSRSTPFDGSSKPGTPENARVYVDLLITNNIKQAIIACHPFDDIKILQILKDLSTALEKMVSKLESDKFAPVRAHISTCRDDIGYCTELLRFYMIFQNAENSHRPLRSLLARLQSDI